MYMYMHVSFTACTCTIIVIILFTLHVALVNKGNCLYAQGQYQSSVEYYREALSVEATCSEALYNLGLAYKKLKDFPAALTCFTKLHTIFKSLPQVLYQIADMYLSTLYIYMYMYMYMYID